MSGDTLHDTTGPGMGSPAGDHAADAEAIIREIERPEQHQGDPTDWRWLPRMDLPGFGERQDTCGDEMFRFCSCCGDSVEVGQTCYRSTCPRCAQEWCRRQATSLAAKLSATWAYQYVSLDEHPYFHHLVISPPEDWKLDHDPGTVYDRTKELVKRIMDELGVVGVPIYHPYRGSEEEPGDDMGEWKERVFSGRDWDAVSEELRFSPHFHIVGISPHVDISVTEQVEAETGWVIHRITQGDSGVSIGNDFDMARVVAYCLSHSGVYKDSNGDYQSAYYPNVLHRHVEATADDETKDEFDQIVRSIAPQTLGIDYSSVACYREVPEGEGRNMTVSLAQAHAEAEPDDGGESSSDQEADTADPDGPRMEKCEGKLVAITEAPQFLDDSEWREKAPLAHRLEETWREWRRRRGIP
jgi:hypothetical protein